VKLDREPIPARNEPIVHFPQEPDYAIVQPVTPEEFIPSIGRWLSMGGIVMVASFGAAIALSTVLKYKVTVQAPASIRPKNRPRTSNWKSRDRPPPTRAAKITPAASRSRRSDRY